MLKRPKENNTTLLGLIVGKIQDKYTSKRVEFGTETKFSYSDIFFRPIREKGFKGIKDGFRNYESEIDMFDEDSKSAIILFSKKILTLISLGIGGVELFLVIAGLNKKERASWEYFK